MDRPASLRLASGVVAPGVDRRDVAWGLLRGLLPEGVVLTNPCPRCGGPHGPVRVGGAPFVASVSYAGTIAVVAVASSAETRAIGVDAEAVVAPHRDTIGFDDVLWPGATVRDWTRVESAVKADGRGLRIAPASVRIAADGAGWRAHVPGASAVFGADAEGPHGVVVSVAFLPTA